MSHKRAVTNTAGNRADVGVGAAVLAVLAPLCVIVAPAAAQPPACDPGAFFSIEAHHPSGPYAIEVEAADFNGDGRPDVAAANFAGNSLTIMLGRPGGFDSRVFAGVASPSNLLAGDFNEDGRVDLAVTSFSPALLILTGDGSGGFARPESFPVPPEPRGLTSADFNEDGIADIAVATPSGMAIMIGGGAGGTGDGTFGLVATYGSAANVWGITTGDFDSDGIADLAAVGPAPFVSIVRGRGQNGVGDGTFSLTYTRGDLRGPQREIVTGDFNGDGVLDLAVAGTCLNILRGQGAGHFILDGIYGNPDHFYNGVSAADFDRDGDLDLVTTNPRYDVVRFFPNAGNGSFPIYNPEIYPCQYGPVGITHADLHHDGALDLIVANTNTFPFGPGSVTILRGTCAGQATPGPPFVSGFMPAGGRVGDAVTILGERLADATSVEFSEGVPATIVAASFFEIRVAVPEGAVSGPVRVTNSTGSATSAPSFFVGEQPVVTDATPRRGRIGDTVVITGDHFTGATRVRFGTSTGNGVPFVVDSDERITATLNTQARTGFISVTTPAATGTGTFEFLVDRRVRLEPTEQHDGEPVSVRYDLALMGVRPNPAVEAFDVELTLASAAPARLELLDVTGRRVATRTVDAAPGPRTVRWVAPPGLARGVYLLRVEQDGKRATTRVALVR